MTDTNTAQMVVDLRATDDAVRAKGWVAPGLGVPGAPLGLLSSSLNPLSGLAAAGLSWFLPMVSFLGEPLTQLQGGDGASVTSGAEGFASGGQDLGGTADAYRESVNTQTSGWSGAAAEEYRAAGAQHADGVEGLGAASGTTSDAIIGAGQVVAQAIAEVTELIAEAVAQIVPIMTQAVARAGETFGQSVVEAIPPCVAIAVEYALRIAAKLAALLASGDNLLKLVQGGMAVVELINTALSSISQQSLGADASGSGAQGTAQAAATGPMAPEVATGAEHAQGSQPASAAGGSGGGPALSGKDSSSSSFESNGSRTPSTSTYSSGFTPQAHVAGPDTARPLGQTGGNGAMTGTGLPLGAAHGAGAGSGLRNGSSVRGGAGRDAGATSQERGQRPGTGAGNGAQAMGAMPMGAMGGMRPGGDADKEHQRKYPLVEGQHDEVFEIDRVLPDELELELPAAEPAIENLDDEYFTNPPEITR